jgi:hypothetical protein
VLFGTSLLSKDDSYNFDFPSAGIWQWRIAVEWLDVDGSTWGGPSVINHVVTRNGGSGTWSDDPYAAGASSVTISSGAYTIPQNWVLDKVERKLTYSYYVYNYENTNDESLVSSDMFSHSTGGIYWQLGDPTLNQQITVNRTITFNSATFYNPELAITLKATTKTAFHNYVGIATVRVFNLETKYYLREFIVNTNATSNEATFLYYNYAQAASQVLATGSLNWLAVGE